MRETLQNLINLQDIDNQLGAIQEKMGDLPDTVQQLKAEIEEKKTIVSTSSNEASALEIKILQNNGKIMDFKAKLEKYQEQLYLVTTNREYDALTNEIDYAKNQISDAEMEILQAGERIKELEEIVKVSEADVKDMNIKLIDAEKSLTETIKSTEEEKAELDEKRENALTAIPRNYYQVYERVRKARRGIAVIHMERDACGGCHNRIIPQKRVEIQKGNKIIFCDICGRYLYFKNEEE